MGPGDVNTQVVTWPSDSHVIDVFDPEVSQSEAIGQVSVSCAEHTSVPDSVKKSIEFLQTAMWYA